MTQSTRRRSAPLNLAIIVDGNGRWATARGLPRAAGHRAGAQVWGDPAISNWIAVSPGASFAPTAQTAFLIT